MPSKDELLQSIAPGMKLDRFFFLKVYGYEISHPGFSEIAIKALEDAGCRLARSYYNQVVDEHERNQNEKIRPVAAWLKEQVDKDYEKGVEGLRKLQEKTKLSRKMVSKEILGW